MARGLSPRLRAGLVALGPLAFLLLVLVAILNGVDLVYTLFAHRLGMLNEMNPLAATFLREGLEPSLVSFKLLMILAGGYLLWRSRRSLWSVAGCWILVLAYGGLSVTWYRWSQEVIRM